MDSFPSVGCPEDSTLLDWEWGPIRASPMNQLMHVLAQEFVHAFISQNTKAGRVAKGAVTFAITSINGLGGRLQNQPEFILTFALCLFRLLAHGNVLNRAPEPDDFAVRA